MTDAATNNARPPLSQLWQMPVLAASLCLFGAGLYLIVPRHAEPPYVGPLREAKAMLDAGRYEPALAVLSKLEPKFSSMPAPFQAQLRVFQADAISLAQQQAGWNTPANHETIARDYQQAATLGMALDADRTRRLAASLAALGRFDAALEQLTRSGENLAEARQKVLRDMITAELARQPLNAPRVAELLDRLRAEKDLDRATAGWAAAREGELLLLQNKPAVDLLLRRYAQLAPDSAKPDAVLAELMVTMGRAYLADADPRNAERWLMRARGLLRETDVLSGRALVGLAQVRLDEGDPAGALELFTQAATRYAGTPVATLAMIGRGEAAARQDELDKALAEFTRAADAVAAGQATPEARRRLLESLDTQCDLRSARGEFDLTLKLLDIERRLAGPVTPPPLLLRIAEAHQQMARRGEGLAEGVPLRGQNLAKLPPADRARVVQHYAAAADAFREHALAVKVSDDAAYGQSLWKAGVYFDLAGQPRDAIDCLTRLIEDRPKDPNRLEAVYRLARAHQAAGQHDTAIRMFQRILDEYPHSREAYASLVPLARCFIAKGPEFLARAEHVLSSVVTDHEALTPDSQEYREALIELGELYYRRGDEGDYERAIERLSEVVQRYRAILSPVEMGALRFQLGDAHRKSVEQINARLAGSLPPSQRAAMTAERARRLDEARRNFGGAIALLAAQPDASLSELRRLDLRNSYFYRADCAYDLRQFEGPEGAIELYTQALSRYEKQPAALIALIQIVNSYGELGQWDKARAANERAKELLKRLPDAAFDDPTLPMNRQHWQRWLDRGGQLAASAATP